MNDTLQIVLPFLTALAVLGVFNLVAYVHLQLSKADEEEDRDLFHS